MSLVLLFPSSCIDNVSTRPLVIGNMREKTMLNFRWLKINRATTFNFFWNPLKFT
jgi:hypothetical protein